MQNLGGLKLHERKYELGNYKIDNDRAKYLKKHVPGLERKEIILPSYEMKFKI